MTRELMQRELVVDLAAGEFQILPVSDPRIVGPVDYGWVRYDDERRRTGRADPEILTWGGGPLAASRIPGTRRLVFTGYSPSWEGFYISSLGGGAYIMHRIGADFVCIRGAAAEDSVLILNHQRGQISVRLEPIDPDVIWAGHANPDGDEYLIGCYALQQAVYDRYKSEYNEDWVRVFAVGPAARHTDQGIIGSNQVRKGRILPIDDWAGRGGLGSRLLQRHRIAACIFGGDWEDPDLKDSKEIDGYFMANYGEPMIKVDLGATEKYRFVPGFQTGGTFGVNYHTVDDRLLSYNYASIYQPEEVRRAQNQAFVRDHYLKQFNEEVIAPKRFAHCGEPCSVACKKYDRIYKKDYEPYQALGPQCGIFDQRAAEELNHFVDAMGLDAIQAGGMTAWIMEMVRDGLIEPAEFGFPPASEMRFGFAADVAAFDLELDSRRNADYAYQVIYAVLFDARCAVFRQGMRGAAKALDERPKTKDEGPADAGSAFVLRRSSFVKRRLHRPRRARLHGAEPVLGAWDAQPHADDGQILRLLRPRFSAATRSGQEVRRAHGVRAVQREQRHLPFPPQVVRGHRGRDHLGPLSFPGGLQGAPVRACETHLRAGRRCGRAVGERAHDRHGLAVSRGDGARQQLQGCRAARLGRAVPRRQMGRRPRLLGRAALPASPKRSRPGQMPSKISAHPAPRRRRM